MKLFKIIFFVEFLFISYLGATDASFKPERFKAVIFDCDGVLIDNGEGYFLDWQYALQQQDFELSADQFWDFMHANELVGLPTANERILEFCCELLGYDCRDVLKKDKERFSNELHQKGFPPVASTIEFLRQLARKKAGCFTIAVPTKATSKQDLSIANMIIESFEEIDFYDNLLL